MSRCCSHQAIHSTQTQTHHQHQFHITDVCAHYVCWCASASMSHKTWFSILQTQCMRPLIHSHKVLSPNHSARAWSHTFNISLLPIEIKMGIEFYREKINFVVSVTTPCMKLPSRKKIVNLVRSGKNVVLSSEFQE